MKKPSFIWFVTKRIFIMVTTPFWVFPFFVYHVFRELYEEWRLEYIPECTRRTKYGRMTDQQWLQSRIDKANDKSKSNQARTTI